MFFGMNDSGCAKRRLALSSSTAVLALLLSTAAQAQEQSVESVVVSSSRIQSADFDAPTPTVAISAVEIQKQGNPNVFTTITQLPSLMGSTGSTVGNTALPAAAGCSLADGSRNARGHSLMALLPESAI